MRCINFLLESAMCVIIGWWQMELLESITPLVRWLRKSANSISWRFQVALLCLVSVGHTNTQLPTLVLFLNWNGPTLISSVKIVWVYFLFLHIWMRILIFIKLYFAIIIDWTCTFPRNVGKSNMSNIDNQNPVTWNILTYNPILWPSCLSKINTTSST